MRREPTPNGMLAVGLVIGIVAAVRLLAFADGDPTVFAAFGEDATELTEYAEELLSRDVDLRAGQGHDGKFFFAQANDPLLLEPHEHASVIDRPIYRYQRMLYPLIAGLGGLLSPEAILWGMVIVNVLSLAAGTWAVALIARLHGLSPLVGLAFGLNFGLLSELFIDGAGALAFALAALGAYALEKEQVARASAAFIAAALTREVMILFAGSIGLIWLLRRRRHPWLLVVPPITAVVAWALYVRARIEFAPAIEQVKEITLVPFSGLIAAMTSGRANLADYLVMAVLVILVFLVPYRASRSEVFLSWGSMGFAVVAPFLTLPVWQKLFDISRALAPLLTVFVFEMFLSRKRRFKAGGRDIESQMSGTG